MENVSFITTEDGDDLIVSFAVQEHDDFDVKSLTLIRTPKYEFVLYDSERGVNVSYDDFPEDENDLLEEIEIASDLVNITTTHRTYNVNIRLVDDDEVKECKKVLKKMNFDNRFKLKIV